MGEFGPSGILAESLGGEKATITGISAVENCGPGDLVFMDKKEYLALIESRRPTAVVTSQALRPHLTPSHDLAVLVAPNVALAHALMKKKYAARDFKQTGWTEIHPSAVIHESASIESGTVIEPRAVIGKNVKIGRDCRIMAGTVVENDAEIGDNTILHPLVVIGYGCKIGNEVVVGSGSVIGSEGYGFAQDAKRKSYPIPQTGIVVIEDRVRVGANNCIDRAAYHVTRVGAGTKLDNFCHVAHNVDIGEDCLLTAFLCVAGSSKLGDRVIASGQTGVLDHVQICNDVVLVQRAGVSKDIDKPGAYAGSPVQPLGEYMKNTAVLRSAAELKKRIADLEKKVGSEDMP
jgi:UDP-3-O-[3-hydroxymyristoyl] glucosamine N-acyltransferase